MRFSTRIIILVAVTLIFLGSAFVFSTGGIDIDPIKFDHGLHIAEAGMSCADCHEGIEETGSGRRSIPDHDVCGDCHEIDDDAACGMCHVDPDSPVSVPDAGILYDAFAHQKHTTEGLKCETCHSRIEKAGDYPLLPAMIECQECHHKRNAPLECSTCHLKEIPLPRDHKLASWSRDHGLEASAGTSDCSKCHKQESCDDCHQGTNIAGDPHPPTWRFNHFAESSYGSECLVCHESRQDCVACHKVTIRRPHPLGESYARMPDGGDHKEDAEAFIEACFSCHDVGEGDPTCAKCHD